MKHILSPAVAFFFILLCLPTAEIVAQRTGNPIMIIRCIDDGEGEEVFTENNKLSNQSKMMADCPAGFERNMETGGCAPMCGTIEGVQSFYNTLTGLCEVPDCDDLGGSIVCDECPEGFFQPSIGCVITCPSGYLLVDGECFEEVPCFDLAIDVTPVIPPCEGLEPGALVPVQLTFTGAGTQLDLGEFVSLASILNCLDGLGDDYFAEVLDAIDSDMTDDNASTLLGPANAAGEIIIDFFAPLGSDIVLIVNGDETTIPVVCEDPIPSMGQWGLMIFALLLSSLGLVFMARKKTA